MNDLVEPVAVVGIAGRFPGAQNIDEFWQNLRAGRECVEFPAEEELLANGVRPEWLAKPNYVRARAEAPDLDLFDAGFFGMTPREAKLCDPHFRLFLEMAHTAVENAGYDPTKLHSVAVFGSTGRGMHHVQQIRAADTPDLMAGVFNFPDYLSTLVSYKLDFTGPSMTVLTACSSSLLTVHLAVQALRAGECDLALAGGVEIELPRGHGYWWTPGGPFSRDGHCRPFDAAASGTIFGSGAGIVLLKRLSDALADGDNVRAVIRGVAANNDGSDKLGFSAPSVSGQLAAAVEAISLSEIRPEAISYVEAHATGTPLGDPIEFVALSEAFRRASAGGADLTPGFCGLGSVKGNVGHLGHAAGITSLLKVVVSLENEELPPSVNIEKPNPKLQIEGAPFHLQESLRPWPRVDGRPRRAGVNSLGFGGTNVHVIVEEAPVRAPARDVHRPRIVLWSGRTDAARDAYERVLTDHLGGAGDPVFAQIVATLQEGRTAHQARGAVVCDDAEQAVAALRGEGGRVVRSGHPSRPRKLAFLFPGQGSQHAGMVRRLHGSEQAFTSAFEQCLDLLADAGCPVRGAWETATEDEQLADTVLAQPLLFAVEYGLARMWQAWGLRPDAVLGHSVGELVAATVAEVIEPADAVRLIAARAKAMAAAPPGAMLAVAASVGNLPELPDEVTVAAVNGPRQTVLSGPTDAVRRFANVLAERKVNCRPVPTSHAFHHSSMARAAEDFAAAFEEVPLRAPVLPMYTAATGALLAEDDAVRPSFWAEQLTGPVLFDQALGALLDEGDDWILLEVGPERVLTSVVRGHPDVSEGRHTALSTCPRRGKPPEEEWRTAMNTLATLWIEGRDVDWTAVRQGEPVQRLPVPGYQYERSRYWYDEDPVPAADTSVTKSQTDDPPAVGRPVEGSPVDGPFTTVAWTETLRADAVPARGDVATLALLPADAAVSLPLVLALQQAGSRIIPVRPGAEYSDDGTEFVVRPGEPGDLRRVIDVLADRGDPVELLVHAWSVGAWETATTATVQDQLDESFGSLLGLIQHGTRQSLPVTVLTSRAVDVSGSDPLDPVKSTLYGLARTLMLEVPQMCCRFIDIGAGVAEDDLVAELRSADGPGSVALRGDRRWTPAERALDRLPANGTRLRREGVYLITGGLGGLGLEVARRLARTGLRPRLALLGRTATEDEPRIRRRLEEMRALGAEVRVFAADVADVRAVRRVLDTVTARFGPVNGVLHLAGVSGGGVLQLRDRKDAVAMLRPKVLGTLVLDELFTERPRLDFFVSFASRAGIDGLAGAGDYAAANAFLDAHARTSGLAGGQALSIGWPAWNTVGMVAGEHRTEATGTAAERRWTTVLTQEYPFLDEHRVAENSVPLLPGTAHLDLAVRAFHDEVAPDALPVSLHDVAFRRALPVGEPHHVEVVMRPDGDSWRFTIRSAAVNAANPDWQEHVTGRIAQADGEPGSVDIAALRARLPREETPAPLAGPGRLIRLGPRWQNVEEVKVSADGGEKLVSLTLPASFVGDLDMHPLHPSILDSATSYARDFSEPHHLPYVYGSVRVYRTIPSRLFSHIRRKTSPDSLIVADVDLIGEDGRIVVAIENFTMRIVDDATFVDGLEKGSSAASAGGTHAGTDRGLPPETGVRLLIDLLESRTPRQVSLLPFRGGRPVLLPGVPAVWLPGRSSASPHVATVSEEASVIEPRGSAPVPVRPAAAATPEPAATERIEDRLRGLWSAVLGITTIEDDADFFDLGGNSLSAIDLMTGIRDEFALEPGISALFDHPTFASLAEALREWIVQG